jgi:type IV secretory pathway TraG/TraD family ATPase VirD4
MVMNNQHLSPSQKRQDWLLMSVAFTLVFISVFAALSTFTWSWVSDWGTLSDHWPFTKPENLFFLDMWREQWLDYWVYYIGEYQLHKHFYAHTGLPALTALLTAFFIASRLYVPGGYDRGRIISGPRRYHYKQALKHGNSQLKRDCHADGVEPGLLLHPKLAIPKNREEQNAFIVGGQGSGKTVVLRPMIQQIIDRGAKSFIYDEKKEFTSWFYREDSAVLIAPWDGRSKAWDIQADVTTDQAAKLVSECMIKMHSGDNAVFSKGARLLFTGMIVILNRTSEQWGWVELARMLSTKEDVLLKLLDAYYPRASAFIVKESKTTQGFFIDIATELDFIHELAEAWPTAYEEGFSITQWTKQDESKVKTVIVQADKRFKSIGAPLCNAMIGLMTATILSQSNSYKRELWLCLDELANLPPNPHLLDWLSLGRSKGCRCLAGTQSVTALQQDSMYGEKGADSLLVLFGLFIALRMGAAGQAAEYCAKAFGEHRVERPTQSGTGEQRVESWHVSDEPLVTASDLTHALPQPGMRGVHGFLSISGWGVYQLRWPLIKPEVIAEEELPAPWLSQTPKPIESTDKTDKSASKMRRGRRR